MNTESTPRKKPATALIGAIAIVAIAASFIMAIMARGRTEIPLVIVTPAGTQLSVSGSEPRNLPNQPNLSEGLASHYFMVDAGDHEVRFREPGKPEQMQVLAIPASDRPVIYTLLRDTLREMKARAR